MSFLKGRSFCIRLINKRFIKRYLPLLVFQLCLFIFIIYSLTLWLPPLFRSRLEYSGVSMEQAVSLLQRNRNLSTYLKLNENTCIYCPEQLYKCIEISPIITVLYFVSSPPQNSLERNAIRSTWGRNVKRIFLTGKIGNETIMMKTIRESQLFQDLIIEDFVDAYTNLTIKTAFMMKHYLLMKMCYPSLYMMKTDDDMYINVHLIQNLINGIKTHDAIIGHMIESTPAQRDPESKWYLPSYLYSDNILPPFITGTAYMIPGNFIERILQKALNVPILNLEDVYFVGIVANTGCNIKLRNEKTFKNNKPLLNYYCLYKDLATAHRLSSSELKNIWVLLEECTELCRGLKYEFLNLIFGLI